MNAWNLNFRNMYHYFLFYFLLCENLYTILAVVVGYHDYTNGSNLFALQVNRADCAFVLRLLYEYFNELIKVCTSNVPKYHHLCVMTHTQAQTLRLPYACVVSMHDYRNKREERREAKKEEKKQWMQWHGIIALGLITFLFTLTFKSKNEQKWVSSWSFTHGAYDFKYIRDILQWCSVAIILLYYYS